MMKWQSMSQGSARVVLVLWFAGIMLTAGSSSVYAAGTIKGKVTDKKSGQPLPFVNVVVSGTSAGASSNPEGEYEITGLDPGTYSLVARLVGHETAQFVSLEVTEGEALTFNFELTEASVQLSEVEVYGASMRAERLTEAPAAVSVIDIQEITLNSGSGQLPKLLESKPGVDIAQSGLNDFNVNTRGFNSSLNRRLLVLLDGRDLAIAFLGAQEWNGLSVPVEDLGRLELVRGPASALYGANAFNGVINIQTPSPREVLGTKITLAGGERNSARIDARHAGSTGPWSYKINTGRFQAETWSVTRKNVYPSSELRFEYPGFTLANNEEVDLKTNRVASTYGSGRLDCDFEDGARSTAEGGITQVENEVFVTGIGRVQVPRALKPWGRISYSNQTFYAQIWAAGRNSREPQLSLSSGLPLIERSLIGQGELQYRSSLLGDKLFGVGGVSFRYQTINTEGTLMKEARNDNATGVYAQLEYLLTEDIKILGAARWDRSTLHDDQFSPKLAVVYSPSRNHSFRATFNKAFQSPNLSELYLHVFRTATNPFTGNISNFAYLGNPEIKVERISGFEIGYKGVLENSLFLTFDAYINVLKDFVTDLHQIYDDRVILPGDSIPRWIWSYTNAGEVSEGGIEIALNYYLSDEWVFDANYSYFDFRVISKDDKDFLIPNAPRNKVNGGITYRKPGNYEVGVSMKYVPSFDWASGIYQGRILAYTLVNLAASYNISKSLSLGLNVTNLLDRKHYQIFGGSLIGRRAIASLTATF